MVKKGERWQTHTHGWADKRTERQMLQSPLSLCCTDNDLGHFWLGYIRLLGHPQMTAHVSNFEWLSWHSSTWCTVDGKCPTSFSGDTLSEKIAQSTVIIISYKFAYIFILLSYIVLLEPRCHLVTYVQNPKSMHLVQHFSKWPQIIRFVIVAYQPPFLGR